MAPGYLNHCLHLCETSSDQSERAARGSARLSPRSANPPCPIREPTPISGIDPPFALCRDGSREPSRVSFWRGRGARADICPRRSLSEVGLFLACHTAPPCALQARCFHRTKHRLHNDKSG